MLWIQLFLCIVEEIMARNRLYVQHRGNFLDLDTFFFPFFAVWELELKAYTLSHSTSPFFVLGFFKIGSRELLAQAGSELRSS
jgi:hypothetical protein